MVCSYAEMRRDDAVLRDVETSLFQEQGQLCAYTGRRISMKTHEGDATRTVAFHIEHLRPQKHCTGGEDTDYGNMVACWPAPNVDFDAQYGAIQKGHWPSLEEEDQFVSPLRGGLRSRFRFDYAGAVSADSGDSAAQETIRRLALDHDELRELRKSAIKSALQPEGRTLSLPKLRKLLATLRRESQDLDREVPTRLRPYCFAIEQAVEREVQIQEELATKGEVFVPRTPTSPIKKKAKPEGPEVE